MLHYFPVGLLLNKLWLLVTLPEKKQTNKTKYKIKQNKTKQKKKTHKAKQNKNQKINSFYDFGQVLPGSTYSKVIKSYCQAAIWTVDVWIVLVQGKIFSNKLCPK